MEMGHPCGFGEARPVHLSSVSPLGKWGEGIAAVIVIAFVVGGQLLLISLPLPVPPSTWRASPLTAVGKVRNHDFFSK